MATNFNELIKRKSVCVVGGASTIDQKMIDASDLVARVNGHWMRQRGRCDILYYSCAEDLDYRMWGEIDLWRGLKFVMINLTHRLFGGIVAERTNWVISQVIEHSIPFHTYVTAPNHAWPVFKALQDLPSGIWSTRELSEKYDFLPLSGVLAIDHLQHSDVDRIRVTGMSLYQNPNGSLPIDAGRHEIAPQLAFFRDIVRADYRIELDETLKKILDAKSSQS